MKIAQIAPLFESVPPRFYGGTERVAYQRLIASVTPLKRFQKASGERKREASNPKNILVPRMRPIQIARVGLGKPSAKARDAFRPVAKPSDKNVVRNAAGEAPSNDCVKRQETPVSSSESSDTS